MFERILLETAANGRRRRWTVALSFLFQCLLVGLAVLIPLISTEAIQIRVLVAVLEPPAVPWCGVPVEKRLAAANNPPSQLEQGRLLAPRQIPKDVSSIVDATPPEAPVIEHGPSGVSGLVSLGSGGSWILNAIGSRPAEPPPSAPPSNLPADKVKVGGVVQQAKLISQPKPVYPPLARKARISGTVRLAAIISEAGAIEELRVVQGPPLLIQAAVEAVQQWRYRPTILNGLPVKVETTIDVIFTLSQ